MKSTQLVLLFLSMFPFQITRRPYSLFRCFRATAELALLVLASTLLLAAAAPSSSQTKPSTSQKPLDPETVTARPEVVMDVTRRDCGDVFAGEEIEQSFGVRNAGTAPLELAQKSSLGTRSGEPGHPAAAGVWRVNDLFVTRLVAASRAAPS